VDPNPALTELRLAGRAKVVLLSAQPTTHCFLRIPSGYGFLIHGY
jgi:hypothetical protein